MRKAYGYRSFRIAELSLFHRAAAEPARFCVIDSARPFTEVRADLEQMLAAL